MNLLIPFLLVCSVDVPLDKRHPDAQPVYYADFSEKYDRNYDGMPDGWIRKEGRQYPKYVSIGITKDLSAVAERCVRIDLDGGAALLKSPPIPVFPFFSYVFEARIKTENLVHDRAYFSITILDGQGGQIAQHFSEKFQQTDGWTKIRIPPFTFDSDEAAVAHIGMHLKPSNQQDLRGAAMFDDVWLARLPKMSIRTGNDYNIFMNPKDVHVTVEVSGILEANPLMSLELINLSSEITNKKQDTLNGKVAAIKSDRVSKRIGGSVNLTTASQTGYIGTMEWEPPIDDYGYYKIRVLMKGESGLTDERSISLAVLRPRPRPVNGRYGWSLPQGDYPLKLSVLDDLLGHVGINWVKFPVWYSEKQPQRADDLAQFAERLSNLGIETVGMLSEPPPDQRSLFGDSETISAATIFSDEEVWKKALNPVMTRLSLKVHWWQLGHDKDASFIEYPQLEQKLRTVKQQLQQFGQQAQVVLPWRWIHELPDGEQSPWDSLTIASVPPLTATELSEHLAATKNNNALRWVVLEPLSREEYGLTDRARDLVARMIAAKMEMADGVFIPDPFDDQRGLMNGDGTPGELLLPWRTTALMLSGTEFIGSITMPSGSTNYLFAREGETIMVVWNDHPTKEIIFLGNKIEQINIWGHGTTPEQDGHRQIIKIGPLPSFITGVNTAIARTRMSFKFDNDRLKSIFGRPQAQGVQFTNHFAEHISGELSMNMPDVWILKNSQIGFRVSAGSPFASPVPLKLKADAESGPQDLQMDFSVSADRPYKFSVYRTLNVGLGEIEAEYESTFNKRGDLVVTVHLINRTNQYVSFRCELVPAERRLQRKAKYDLPQGRKTIEFVLPRGRELIGQKITLRISEMGGQQRRLNYPFTVAEPDE